LRRHLEESGVDVEDDKEGFPDFFAKCGWRAHRLQLTMARPIF
jgi:hypothetical protein